MIEGLLILITLMLYAVAQQVYEIAKCARWYVDYLRDPIRTKQREP